MNCPMHSLIFRARGRSYRELPLRLFEFGSVYRYEKSGVVHGLTRVRGMTQDDAHIYCTREQMQDELATTADLRAGPAADYGLDDFYLELSTKDPEKYVGTDEVWEEATAHAGRGAPRSGLELVPDPGGAAFYGPKISVQARDAIGRTWQMSTIQLDFNLPERFELEYPAADGDRQRPVMIHRALFGSVERFFGVLIEHYAGAFPAWLAPVQVVGIPVGRRVRRLPARRRRTSCGRRASASRSTPPTTGCPKKIRNASKDKVPFVLIAGGEDAEAGAVCFRFRDGSQHNGVPVDEAVARIVEAVAGRGDRRWPGRPGGAHDGRADDEAPTTSSCAGVPDAFQRLWTPHRMAYIKGGQGQSRTSDECPFCVAPSPAGRGRLIVHRGETAYVVLNLYPYNPGHLLVCPYRHVPDYTDLTAAETAEIAELTQTAMRVLRKVGRTAAVSTSG